MTLCNNIYLFIIFLGNQELVPLGLITYLNIKRYFFLNKNLYGNRLKNYIIDYTILFAYIQTKYDFFFHIKYMWDLQDYKKLCVKWYFTNKKRRDMIFKNRMEWKEKKIYHNGGTTIRVNSNRLFKLEC